MLRSRQVKRAQKTIDVPSDMQKTRPTDCKCFIQQTFLTEDGEIASAHQVTLDAEKTRRKNVSMGSMLWRQTWATAYKKSFGSIADAGK